MVPLLLAAIGPALAAPVDPFEEPDEADLFAIEERLITSASRYAQTTREAPAIVTVITDREIRLRGFRTLADLLRTIPGIYLSMAPESRTLGYFRGVVAADNNKFLLLVDGVPWYDGVYTHAWIDEYLPLSIVKQVEVIKGPGSAIYGTNAFAGVVNVVTYGPRDLKGGFARAAVGSAATGDGSVIAGDALAEGEDAWVLAYARWHQALGDGTEVTPKGRADVSGYDPVRSLNAGFRLEISGFSLRYDHVDYRHTYFTQEQDDPFDIWLQSFDEYYLDYRNEYLSARWRIPVGANTDVTPFWTLQDHDNPGLYAWISDPYEDDDGIHLSGTLVDTKKHTRRYAAGVDVESRPTSAHVIVGGAGAEVIHLLELRDDTYEDFSHDRTDPSGFQATPDQRIQVPYAYAQDTWTALTWLETTAGLRADYNLIVGSLFLSPRLGVLLVPASDVSTKLLYGRAFRAPSARELLVDRVATDDEGDFVYTAGNPDLAPERIDTIEAEATWTPTVAATLRGAAFYSTLGDTIDKGDDPNQYVNLAEGVDVLGAEAEAGWKRGPWDLSLSYAWTRARDQATGYPVYEFPPHMAHARAGWTPLEGLILTAMVDQYSKRPREDWTPNSGLEDGPAFTLVHATLATDALGDGRIRADLSVRNLLDADYDTLIYGDDADAVSGDAAKYPEDIDGEGRIVTAGVEVAF